MRTREEINAEYGKLCAEYGDNCLKSMSAEARRQEIVKLCHELSQEMTAVNQPSQEVVNEASQG